MVNEVCLPTAALVPFVKEYRIIETTIELVNRVLPNTSPALAFNFRGSINYLNNKTGFELPKTAFSGLRKSVRLINYAALSSALIVLFTETGAAAFFKHPLQELFEESIALDHLVASQKVADLEEQLSAAPDSTARISIVENFLLANLTATKPDALITQAVREIRSSKGLLRTKALADKLYISQDAFEKRFRRIIGSSPKQFSSIVRLNTLIRQKTKTQSIADLTWEGNYYDPSHFNKDFKIFTGQSPVEFFQSGVFW